MKKIFLVAAFLFGAMPTFSKASRVEQPVQPFGDDSQEVAGLSTVKDALHYCFATKSGFEHLVHKAALLALAVKGGSLVMNLPQKSRLYGAGALLYSLWLGYNYKIKKYTSEEYFADGVGEALEQHILNFLPIKESKKGDRSAKIKDWMEKKENHGTVLQLISEKLQEHDKAAIKVMKAQLDGDIVTLGDWHVPCSNFFSWCRRVINGGSANYSMQNIDSFAAQEIEGSEWDLMNLLDIRFGSSAYKIKMMKMVLLRKLLDFI